MPYEVKKSGSQFCVFKKGTSEKVPGGCHATKADAVNHMKALYSNVDASIMERAKALAAGQDPDVSALTVLRDVEMMKTGIDYPLASGKMTFTKEDLADVVASQQDPAIQAPRLKIGHTDPRFDGEPALGKWINLRLTDEGQTVVGDCVGIPKWLAGIVGSAFPARSIEGNRDVETVTGNKWRVAVESVALLGIQWPGVSTLDDLPILFSEEGPDGVEVVQSIAAAKAKITAANVEDIRRQFYDSDVADGWMWVREIYVEPNELIADDGDGGLYRVPYTVDGDTVTYGEATPVKIVYQDVAPSIAASLYAQGLHDSNVERVVASYSDPESAGASVKKEEGEGMDPEVLKALGLSEDATQEQVTAALRDKGLGDLIAETPQPTPKEGEQGESSDGSDEEEATEEADADSLVELAAKRGLVLVDSEGWKEVQAGAKAGQELAAARADERRDSVLNDAIKAGKFPPARKEHFAQLYKADPKGTEELLAGMAGGIVPIDEHGVAGSEGTIDDAYPDSWFPEIAAAKASHQEVPGTGKVINERKVVN